MKESNLAFFTDRLIYYHKDSIKLNKVNDYNDTIKNTRKLILKGI